MKIKRCTTLYDLLEEDWTDEVCSVIRDFFEIPGTEVLSIYFNEVKLEATLTIPQSPIQDLTYFIKVECCPPPFFLCTVIFVEKCFIFYAYLGKSSLILSNLLRTAAKIKHFPQKSSYYM